MALVAAALTITLAGCDIIGDGRGGGSAGAGGDGTSAEAPTSIDPALLECGDPDNTDPTLQLSDIELVGATWTLPEGFVETFKYSEDLPLEHIESFWAAEPAENPVDLNVLAVVVYSGLDWGANIDECGRVPITAIDERLASYREGTGAEPLSDIASVEVSGLPAVQQELSLPEYSYQGYWVFSRNQMIHLYCQWTSDDEKERIVTGCDALLASLEVAGA